MVLIHADSYPLMTEDRSKHKEMVRRIATAAEERMRDALGFEDKTISMHKLEKALKDPNMKELERTLKAPANTPEDAANSLRAIEQV